MATSTLIVPIGDVYENPDNPRSEYDDDAMKELVASVKANGIITPLVVWPRANGNGESEGYVILAGHRRRRAAEAAGLTELPVHVPEGQLDETAVMVADNVIRADLSPLEEARAYERLVKAGHPTARVAKMVGRAKATVERRLNLLVLPDDVQELIADHQVALSVSDVLGRIASQDAVLASLVAAAVASDPGEQADLLTTPGDIVDAVLSGGYGRDPQAQPVAYSVGEWQDPITPRPHQAPLLDYVVEKLGDHGKRVSEAYEALPEIPGTPGDYDHTNKRSVRDRTVFKLDESDVDAARAYGCLLTLVNEGEGERHYLCDADFVATCIVKRIEEWAKAEPDTWKVYDKAGRSAASRDPNKPGRSVADQEDAKQKRDEAYEQRTAARKRNLELGVKAEQTAFKLDLDAAKLLVNLLLDRYGEGLVWAHRLCVDQPETTAKNGRVTVHYPREMADRAELVKKLREKVARAKTPDEAWSIVARLLGVQHLVDTAGHVGADVNAVYEPYELRDSKLVGKLATAVQPASVKRHRAQAARSKRDAAAQGPSTPEGTGGPEAGGESA